MIKVSDRFYIDAGVTCYVLLEKTFIKNTNSVNYGKEIFKELGYYSTLESCINGILKFMTREFISKEEENSMQDLIKEINKQDKWLKSLNLKV